MALLSRSLNSIVSFAHACLHDTTATVLKGHKDEVWYIAWSHDGALQETNDASNRHFSSPLPQYSATIHSLLGLWHGPSTIRY
ncbi:hypothetical protein BYT27DRAFT_6838229 [Phlegmacium glaucopus]|nr:hypothetical protein BYT27DRAFT_6838229 [Phlegmacium glaucopus]